MFRLMVWDTGILEACRPKKAFGFTGYEVISEINTSLSSAPHTANMQTLRVQAPQVQGAVSANNVDKTAYKETLKYFPSRYLQP